jgi:hypothetical protein
MPFFEFVNSPVNNIGLTQEVAPGGGKIRTVRLTYTPRQLESAVTANIANPKCDVSNFIGDRYTDYTLDRKDYYVGVDCPEECHITLPLIGNNVYNGRTVVVKDESGNCVNCQDA